MEFDSGSGTFQDGTGFSLGDNTGVSRAPIATYDENGYRFSLIQTNPNSGCTSMTDYYGEPGSSAEVMHIHFAAFFSGCVTSVRLSRLDGEPFLLTEVGVTTHTGAPGGPAFGGEDAYIADDSGVEFNIPPNDWGDPTVYSRLPFTTPTTEYTIQPRTFGNVGGLGFAFLTFSP